MDRYYADTEAADAWMKTWIAAAATRETGDAAPDGAMYLGRFADAMYFLTQPIGWQPNAGQAGGHSPVRVPTGFVTDFASVPRIFWTWLPPDGLYAYAAVIHDYLYWEQSLSRSESDEILKLCMEDFQINTLVVAAIYRGVRLGGQSAWDQNARLKKKGEKRMLKTFPSDPTVRWGDWKIRGVFIN